MGLGKGHPFSRKEKKTADEENVVSVLSHYGPAPFFEGFFDISESGSSPTSTLCTVESGEIEESSSGDMDCLTGENEEV
ncbi:hypothetical protein XELAEV_18003797mg [Xenopus laevis]|uniref:Uncharacterized protein n=1 Tax=Xenopus laevis TaxID=8355 RepID=A0A974GYF9_XENLA|nr:hypothetical protein XELAEV_18003797mg [Xenopus laevis]